jgi:hypothetical protein
MMMKFTVHKEVHNARDGLVWGFETTVIWPHQQSFNTPPAKPLKMRGMHNLPASKNELVTSPLQ